MGRFDRVLMRFLAARLRRQVADRRGEAIESYPGGVIAIVRVLHERTDPSRHLDALPTEDVL